jgi:hypothetical protein
MMELLIINLIQPLQQIGDILVLLVESVAPEQPILLDLLVVTDSPTLLLDLLHLLGVNQLRQNILDDLLAEGVLQFVSLVNQRDKLRDLLLRQEEPVQVLKQLLVRNETQVLLQDGQRFGELAAFHQVFGFVYHVLLVAEERREIGLYQAGSVHVVPRFQEYLYQKTDLVVRAPVENVLETQVTEN